MAGRGRKVAIGVGLSVLAGIIIAGVVILSHVDEPESQSWSSFQAPENSVGDRLKGFGNFWRTALAPPVDKPIGQPARPAAAKAPVTTPQPCCCAGPCATTNVPGAAAKPAAATSRTLTENDIINASILDPLLTRYEGIAKGADAGINPHVRSLNIKMRNKYSFTLHRIGTEVSFVFFGTDGKQLAARKWAEKPGTYRALLKYVWLQGRADMMPSDQKILKSAMKAEKKFIAKAIKKRYGKKMKEKDLAKKIPKTTQTVPVTSVASTATVGTTVASTSNVSSTKPASPKTAISSANATRTGPTPTNSSTTPTVKSPSAKEFYDERRIRELLTKYEGKAQRSGAKINKKSPAQLRFKIVSNHVVLLQRAAGRVYLNLLLPSGRQHLTRNWPEKPGTYLALLKYMQPGASVMDRASIQLLNTQLAAEKKFIGKSGKKLRKAAKKTGKKVQKKMKKVDQKRTKQSLIQAIKAKRDAAVGSVKRTVVACKCAVFGEKEPNRAVVTGKASKKVTKQQQKTLKKTAKQQKKITKKQRKLAKKQRKAQKKAAKKQRKAQKKQAKKQRKASVQYKQVQVGDVTIKHGVKRDAQGRKVEAQAVADSKGNKLFTAKGTDASGRSVYIDRKVEVVSSSTSSTSSSSSSSKSSRSGKTVTLRKELDLIKKTVADREKAGKPLSTSERKNLAKKIKNIQKAIKTAKKQDLSSKDRKALKQDIKKVRSKLDAKTKVGGKLGSKKSSKKAKKDLKKKIKSVERKLKDEDLEDAERKSLSSKLRKLKAQLKAIA